MKKLIPLVCACCAFLCSLRAADGVPVDFNGFGVLMSGSGEPLHVVLGVGIVPSGSVVFCGSGTLTAVVTGGSGGRYMYRWSLDVDPGF